MCTNWSLLMPTTRSNERLDAKVGARIFHKSVKGSVDRVEFGTETDPSTNSPTFTRDQLIPGWRSAFQQVCSG